MSSRGKSSDLLLFSVAFLIASSTVAQEGVPSRAGAIFLNDNAFITAEPSVGYYFRFQGTPTVDGEFRDVGMAFGYPAAFRPPFQDAEPSYFFRAEAISIFAPRDSDGDGMDDLYELSEDLNPLDAVDAALPSEVAGLTNLEHYRRRYGYNDSRPQVYSREISAFNFGAARFTLEAYSREQSIFNFGRSNDNEAIARELSVFNGERFPSAAFPKLTPVSSRFLILAWG